MRKHFLQLLIAACLLSQTVLATDKPAQPNIVFILFDDLGYGEPPLYRTNSPFKMPTLDRLAREGMRFTDAHTPSAVCTPTRYGVITGRYPMRIGQFGVLGTYSSPFEGKSGTDKYGDWILQGDTVTGQILDALERNHLSGNTLVIVTSDNGAEHRPYPPLRESKRSIYEGGHRVPFLARWPGKIKPGSTCLDVVCLADLMATAAEISGAAIPANAGEDSVSILPDLLGTAKAPVREATVHQSMAGDLAIRQGPWKLIFKTTGVRELYNLTDDLSETRNVITNQADISERLAKLMQSYITNGRSTPGAPQKNKHEVKLDGSSRKKKTAGSQTAEND